MGCEVSLRKGFQDPFFHREGLAVQAGSELQALALSQLPEC